VKNRRKSAEEAETEHLL